MNLSFLNLLIILLLQYTVLLSNTQQEIIIFSHDHGFYAEPFTLGIDCEISEAQLHYTFDGSDPFTNSNASIADFPFTINVNPNDTFFRDYAPGFVLRVCAVVDEKLVSDVITQTYMFPNKILELSIDNMLPGPGWLKPGNGHDINYGLDPDIYNSPAYSSQMESAFSSLPTLSVVTDFASLFDPDSGIYVNALYHGKEWERSASLELLNPDGSQGFQINCGIRIRGGWSRHYDNPKHAFRFIFRNEYGSGKLKYPLFGDEGVDEFDNIDLRTSQNYSWSYYGDPNNTFMREVFSRDTQRDMNQPYTRSRFYHLFINGTYWGLYQTQERSEASFAESYFGGNSDDYDVIKVDVGTNFNVYNVEATDGTLTKWKELWDAGQIGYSSDEEYYKVQGLNLDGSLNSNYEKLLDVDNLIDYMIITFFVGDFDGPISGFRNNNSPNNFYAIYNRVNPDGFKFLRHDAEHSLLLINRGVDRTGPFSAGQEFLDSNPQWIHQKLSENKNYRLRFADRVYKHFFNGGALTFENNIERINNRKNQIETAIIAESARWGDSKSNVPLTKTNWNNAINLILNSFLPNRQSEVLNQLKDKGLFISNSPPQFSVHGGIVDKGYEAEIISTVGDIYFTTNGSDPFLPFGSESNDFSKTVIEQSSIKKVLIPNSPISNDWISQINFNDDNWLVCNGSAGGIGFDNKSVYTPYISLSVKTSMHESGNNPNTSCFIRVPFDIEADDLSIVNQMYIDMMYDDGFIAYLNGVKILEQNVPNSISWNSTSLTYLDSKGFERFDLSNYLSILNEGENILAIHGLNTSIQSSDFLILPMLFIARQTVSGSISPFAKLYDNPIPIEETITIKTRSLNNNNWSLLNEAQFIIDEDLRELKITELHYHPIDQIVNQDTINDSEYEFIELKNIGNNELNLTGSFFDNGVLYEFSQGSIIPAGGFKILVSNAVEFENRYGFLPDGEYNGQLNNGGERVTLKNAAQQIIISFKYDDKFPWPEAADGGGYSLVSSTRNPIGDVENSDYWTLSNDINGSPGTNDLVSDVLDEGENIPYEFSLSQNYPNPFNPQTMIEFTNQSKQSIKLEIFNILGEKINTLVDSELAAGLYRYTFDGSKYVSGIYFYKLSSESNSFIKKMILLK